MPFAVASACPPDIEEPKGEIDDIAQGWDFREVRFPRLFPYGPDLPANPTLIYERGSGGDTTDIVVESDGHPVPFRATFRDEYIQLDIALAKGPLKVRLQEGREVLAEFRGRSPTTICYQVGSNSARPPARLTDTPLRIETDALLQRLEWEDGAVEPWSLALPSVGIDELFYASDSGVGKRFRLVGLFVDGRTETILESVHLGREKLPLGLSAGEPVSGRAFAGLVICLLFGLFDFRRFARAAD